jgi:hypothetical protein
MRHSLKRLSLVVYDTKTATHITVGMQQRARCTDKRQRDRGVGGIFANFGESVSEGE